MKFFVLAAVIAAIAVCDPEVEDNTEAQWPWQEGKLYQYDVVALNLAKLEGDQSSGSVFKARFIIRAKLPHRLTAKLEQPRHALLHQNIANIRDLPQDLTYVPLPNLDQHFEIAVEGGRVLSLTLPSNFFLPQENLIKGLIGALQVDLSTHRAMHNTHDQYDKEKRQGQFSKMETDVTGDCKTLYTVSPVASEWRRELTHLQPTTDPIEITKSKNYGHCHHRVAYHFGVPKGSEWTGTAHKAHEEQLVRRSTVSRILAGKQGPIYKAETTSSVQVHPHLYGKQKGEVISYIEMNLVSFKDDSEPAWPDVVGRSIPNLLYSMIKKYVTISEDRSSSSSSSESVEHKNAGTKLVSPRARRSLKKIVSINKVVVKRSDEDSSSSSSSSSSQSSDNNEDLPDYRHYSFAASFISPQRGDRRETPMDVQKLLQEMAQQLKNPNNMPVNDFLSKFNIVVSILSSVGYDRINRISKVMEKGQNSDVPIKADMWNIYRDAVAQVGTLAAFQQIRSWIQTKKIQEEEAAQVIASLAASMRYPTKEIMVQFFDLAMSDDVRQQKRLNSTALLTATRLINQAQVNNATAHDFYPTHMYGHLAHKHDPFVYKVILPRLSQELSQAVQQKDSAKAQVYIRAIGNLGHRQILQEYVPYLEGQVPISKYLRREIVNSLDVLAHQQDKLVRSVLYKILKNTAEPYEVRVAAIHNLMMARPTPAMMMAMAQMTYTDPAIHVRAALKSSIKSAAELKSPRYLDLARTASAAKWMLSNEDLGVQYSGKKLEDCYEEEYEQNIMSAFSYTGSRDSLFPNFLKYSLRSKSWNNANSISASFSNVRQFSNYIQEQISKMYQPNKQSQSNQRFPPEKVSEQLNIKRDEQQPFEASFYVDIMNQQRYFAFNDYDLQQLPKTISEYFANLGAGIDKHYTKVLNQAQVSIMFPVATGMPFIYRYKEPTVVHIVGKVKGELPKGKSENPSATFIKEVYFTYARNLDGNLGYMDTLADLYVSAGVVNKLQVNIPVKLELQMKSGQVKINLEPLRPDQDQTILHYSVWPYTTRQLTEGTATVSHGSDTKVIKRPYQQSTIDYKFGQTLGTVFHVNGYSYSSDYKNPGNMWRAGEWLSNIAFASTQKDIALTCYELKYLAKQSQNKRISLTAVYDGFYNLKEKAHDDSSPSKIEDAAPNSEARRQQLVKRASAGIDTAQAQVLDLSATFEGPQQSNFVLTYAVADSLVDRKTQYALYAARSAPLQPSANNQINGFGKIVKPQGHAMNFKKALENEMKTIFEANINYGQDANGKINCQGYAERTQNYVEQLKIHPLAKICQEDVSHNNLYQDACKKFIVKAHAPDYIQASVSYKDVSPAVRYALYRAYKMLEHWGYWYTEVNPMKVTADGKLDMEAKISYFEKKLDLALNTRLGEVRAKNVPIPKISAEALSSYTPFSSNENVINYYTKQQYQPFCTIDNSVVRTFSNRTYKYTLSSSWHVAIQHDGDQACDKLVVLTRRPSKEIQEFYIAYKANNGMHLEMDVQQDPENQKYRVNVNTNAKKISEGQLTIYYDDLEQIPLVQYYTGSDNVLQVSIKEDRLRAMFDGQHLVLLSSEERNNNRGICGYMSGSPRYDYLTPYGIVESPEQYAASYTLKEQSDPETELHRENAKKSAYQPKNKYTAILKTDSEWRKITHSHSSSSSSSSEENYGDQSVLRSRSYLKNRMECKVQQQVQYYENNAEICITTAPVPACQSHCRATSFQSQEVQVICRPKVDKLFNTYRDAIRQGMNPMVEGNSKTEEYRIPITCEDK